MNIASTAESFVLGILDFAPEVQAEHRAELARSDPQLSLAVEELFALLDESPVACFDPSKIPGPRVPELPGFRIQAELGWGGMGLAYRVYDEDLDRVVVLKTVVESRWGLNPWYERFELEARITAQLQVQGVPPVFRRGTLPPPDGRPYLLMHLVQGQSLDVLLGNRQSSADRLPLFIDIFAGICETVGHAHAKGIIHRDIKPANIFIEGQREAIVLDWGLAKDLKLRKANALDARPMADVLAQEHGGARAFQPTQYGTRMGTRGFWSPEALRGEIDKIDARSDVFSLGSLLALILLGRNELQAIDDPDELEGAVHRTQAALGGSPTDIDLHRLASCCLQLRPEDRPADASVLAARVRGFQLLVEEGRRNAEIEAARAAVRIQAQLRATRAAFLFAAVILIAGIIAFFQYLRAEQHAADMAIQKTLAEANERLARERADENKQLAQSEQLAKKAAEASATSERHRAEELEMVSRFQETQLSQIDIQQMGARLRSRVLDASASEERAAVESGLAAANFVDLALEILWDDVFERALAAIEQDLGKQPILKARLLQSLASTMRELGLLEQSTAPQGEALAIRRRELTDGHPDTLSSINDTGLLLQSQGKLVEAVELLTEALEASSQLRGEDDRNSLAIAGNLANVLRTQGRYEEADRLLQHVLDSMLQLFGEDHADTLISRNNMGMLRLMQGRMADAEPLLRETWQKRLALFGPENNATQESLVCMIRLFIARGQLEEAERHSRELLVVLRKTRGDDHPLVASAIGNLGVILQDRGQLEEAEFCLREALERHQEILGALHPDALTAEHNVGFLLHHQGRLSEAEHHYRVALEGRRRVLTPDHPNLLASIDNLARLLRQQEKLSEAESLYTELLAKRRRVLGEDHYDTLMAIHRLGQVLSKAGKLAEAEALFREDLEKSQRILGHAHADTHVSAYNLAELLLKMGRNAEAQLLLEPLVPAARDLLAKTGRTEMLGMVLRTLGLAYGGQATPNARRKAEELLLEAYAVYAALKAPQNTESCVRDLVELYSSWNEAEPSAGYDQKAAIWSNKLVPSGDNAGR